jgi:phosphate transport system substrate-binding protein
MRPSEADGASRIGSLIVHSWPVQTAGGALIAVLVGWAAALYLNRKRVAWRAYVDKPITPSPDPARHVHGLTYTLSMDKEKVDNPQLVLLRVRNAGLVDLKDEDFRLPLTFLFPGRRVRGAEISSTERIDPRSIEVETGKPPEETPRELTLAERIGTFLRGALHARAADPVPSPAVERGGEQLRLNIATLNRRARFTVLVILSQRGTRHRKPRITVSGQLFAGDIEEESARFGPSTRSLLFGGMAVLPLAGLLAGLFLGLPASAPDAMPCPGGSLQLVGSTAFATAAAAIAKQYEQACDHASTISVSSAAATSDTFNGLNTLIQAGAGSHDMAMSDGPAPSGGEYARLVGTPIAVITFALIDNRDTDVYNLTTTQVRKIFAGQITSWNQLGGASLPIRIVSRIPGSGTRRAFDQYVLGGNEPGASSYSCLQKDLAPAAPQILCQQSVTQQVLQDVAGVPGAIGYAETGDVSSFGSPAVEPVELDGLAADIYGDLGSTAGKYQFWTVEYLYSYGAPRAGSLAADFLAYMTSSPAKVSLYSYGYHPCLGTSQTLNPLCSPSARQAS